MARRMYDLDNGVEKIKVASIDTPNITHNGKNALVYNGATNRLNIGNTADYDLTSISGSSVSLDAALNGSIALDATGVNIISAQNTSINCLAPIKLPNHETAERPTANEGSIIYDSTLKKCILYNGTAWVNLDGTALSS